MKVFLTNLCILLCAALLMQGFQCKSSEMTTASIAANNKEWDKAEEYLEKELRKNPTNGEAWHTLGQVRYEKKNTEGMIAAFAEARKYVKDQNMLNQMSYLEQTVWVDSFNEAIELYNKALGMSNESERMKGVRESIKKMQTSIDIRPAYLSSYTILAQMHEAVGDTARFIEALEYYVDANREAVDLLVQKEVMLGTARSAVQKTVGNPTNVKGMQNNKDSVLIDYYKSLDGKETYMFYAEKGNEFVLKGACVNPPASWSQADKELYSDLDMRNYAILALYYYNHSNYDKAMKLLSASTSIQPDSEEMMKLQMQIMEKTGNREEAMKKVADLAKKYPDNKAYLVQYGAMLANINQNDAAIEQFEKALAIDPNYDIALYNIAAAFKNKAGVVQQEEQKKVDSNPKYQPEESRYLPMLQKSATYFENYRKLPGKDSDFGVIEQLLNIYQVTRNDQKVKVMVAELEGTEPLYQNNRRYYELLGQIYGKLGKTDKAKQAFDKADKLR